MRPRMKSVVSAAVLVVAAAAASAQTGSGTRLADAEYEAAVQVFRAGRTSEAFGRFHALANRGDVDAARISLFLHQYGAALYGKQWDAFPADVAYWNQLVRNSPTAARPQPDVPPTVLNPGKGPVTAARSRPGAVKNVAAVQ